MLVFCDADVLLAPGAARALLGEMNRQRADAFSVFSRHITGGWAERLLVPLIVDVVLCFLPFGLLRAPVPAAATAPGTPVEVEIFGEWVAGEVAAEPLYDPSGERLRS